MIFFWGGEGICVLRELICLFSLKSIVTIFLPLVSQRTQYSISTQSVNCFTEQSCHHFISHSSNGNTKGCNWCGWETNIQAIKMSSVWWSQQCKRSQGLGLMGVEKSIPDDCSVHRDSLWLSSWNHFWWQLVSNMCCTDPGYLRDAPEQPGSRCNSRACMREGWGHVVIHFKL